MQHRNQSFISNENAGKASVGVAALPGASGCKLWQDRREQRCWERVTGRGSYTTRQALHSQEIKAEKAFEGSLKMKGQNEVFKGL
jgi:hypothetical protein